MHNFNNLIKATKILEIIISKLNEKMWLLFLTIAVSFLGANQFNLFKIMQENKLYIHKEIQQAIFTEHANAIQIVSKNKKGIAIIEFIHTEDRETNGNPSYTGYVSSLLEFDNSAGRVIETMTTRLNHFNVAIAYSDLFSKEMNKYAMDENKNRMVLLSMPELKKIDKVATEKMFINELIVNGVKYNGNFNFLVDQGYWAFYVKNNKIIAQSLILMDKDFVNNADMEVVRTALENARNKIEKII